MMTPHISTDEEKTGASQEATEPAKSILGEREAKAAVYEQALRRIAGPCESDRFDGSCLDFADDPERCAPCVATEILVLCSQAPGIALQSKS